MSVMRSKDLATHTMSNNAAAIAELKAEGWFYMGKCACRIPMDKVVKTGKDGVRYELKLEVNRDRWQLHKWNTGIIASGNHSTLINTVKGI